METGFSLHFNYKKNTAWEHWAFVFNVAIQPTVYKVKLCFINPPEENYLLHFIYPVAVGLKKPYQWFTCFSYITTNRNLKFQLNILQTMVL